MNSGDNSDIFSCFSVKTSFVTSRWWWDLAGKSDIIFLFLKENLLCDPSLETS